MGRTIDPNVVDGRREGSTPSPSPTDQFIFLTDHLKVAKKPRDDIRLIV